MKECFICYDGTKESRRQKIGSNVPTFTFIITLKLFQCKKYFNPNDLRTDPVTSLFSKLIVNLIKLRNHGETHFGMQYLCKTLFTCCLESCEVQLAIISL